MRREVVVEVVVVRRGVRTGEAPLFRPMEGVAVAAFIAAEMMSGEPAPVPAGEVVGGRTGANVQSSIMGM